MTTEIDRLIERLRARVKIETACGNRTESATGHVKMMDEAADQLELLKPMLAERERLMEALRAIDNTAFVATCTDSDETAHVAVESIHDIASAALTQTGEQQ